MIVSDSRVVTPSRRLKLPKTARAREVSLYHAYTPDAANIASGVGHWVLVTVLIYRLPNTGRDFPIPANLLSCVWPLLSKFMLFAEQSECLIQGFRLLLVDASDLPMVIADISESGRF